MIAFCYIAFCYIPAIGNLTTGISLIMIELLQLLNPWPMRVVIHVVIFKVWSPNTWYELRGPIDVLYSSNGLASNRWQAITWTKVDQDVITRLYWLNSLWPSDAIWRHGSGSILAQVMACCLTAPSQYLNQCWLIISKIQLHSSGGNFTRDISVINDLD